MRRPLERLRRRAGEERGAAMILVAIGLPVFILFGVFVIDVGNWWVHKRHLQTQADAAALAGAMKFRFPNCNDDVIAAEAIKYSGAQKWDTAPASYADAASEYNAQIGGSAPAKLFAGINRPSVYGREAVVIDTDLVGSPKPCTAGFVDVKATETDLPWFFQLGASFLDPFTDDATTFEDGTEFIDAQARVALKKLVSGSGLLPVGVEDVVPKKVHAWFYEETSSPSTAQLLGESDLKLDGPDGRLAIWSNSVAVDGTPVSFSPHTSKIAVRIGMSGNANTDWSTTGVCSQPLVLCYGYGTPATVSDGVTRIRGVDPAASGVAVGRVELLRGTCADPTLPANAENGYFASSCDTVTAKVQMLGANPATGTLKGRITGQQGNSQTTFTFDDAGTVATGDDRWVATLQLRLADGAHKIDLSYTDSAAGSTCTNRNPCGFADVHSSFKGSRARSGPLKMVRIDTVTAAGTETNSNNVTRCPAGQSCETTFIVRIGLAGDLDLAQPGDPPISLRVFGGSQNQSLDCDPFQRLITDTGQTQTPALDDEIAIGCKPEYTANDGATACPNNQNDLWDLPNPPPWQCVAIQTGTNANAPARGLNRRVYGDPSPGAACPASGANHYPNSADDPDYPFGDKREVLVFRVPFGTFDGSGGGTVPVIGFAWFYVTGWTSNGNGFQNPCEDEGDVFAFGTEDDAGSISGHFVIKVDSNTGGAGDEACDTTTIGGCVAVMTK